MIRQKTSNKAAPLQATSKRSSRKPEKPASGSHDFGAILALIDDANERGAFAPKAKLRLVATPTVTSSPGSPTPNRSQENAPLERILMGTKTDEQQLRALEAAARTELKLPAEALIVGERVTAQTVTYGGQARAGLRLECVRNGQVYTVSLTDVVFPPDSAAARFVSLYRGWLGLAEPSALNGVSDASNAAQPANEPELSPEEPVELVVLACKSNALRCRRLGSSQELTLRTVVRDEFPGAIITVTPAKHWTHAGHAYLSGSVVSLRSDVEALGLEPLELRGHPQWLWDPKTEYWGEKRDKLEPWAKQISARGKRPMFEMQQRLPSADETDTDPNSDPIVEASELNASGDRAAARALLMNLLAKELRCLDAHAHLGNFEFDDRPAQALRHYELGLRIGILACGPHFDAALPWGLLDNRPFLRCLNGFGLCAWRLGEPRLAAAVFTRLLWLNPGDNQGARFNLAGIGAGKTWEELEGDDG